MAKNNFLTDKFSTTGGLAAVAYGSSELFYTVADQIRAGSISSPLDDQLPSNLILDFVNTQSVIEDAVKRVLESEYSKMNEFTDFIDIFCGGDLLKYVSSMTSSLLALVNRVSDYNSSLEGLVEESLEESAKKARIDPELKLDYTGIARATIKEFISENYLIEDLNKVMAIAVNNPITKISAAPPDRLVPLNQEGRLGKTYRGVDINVGTTSVENYYSGVSSYDVTEGSIQSSVSQGYVGYPLAALLGESLLDKDSLEYYSVEAGASSSVTDDPLYNINLATINLSN